MGTLSLRIEKIGDNILRFTPLVGIYETILEDDASILTDPSNYTV